MPSARTAEQAAQKILNTVHGDGIRLPVDPVTVARSLGANVWSTQLPNNVSGVFVRTRHGEAEIFVNARNAATRQRLTAAHCLGHAIMGDLEPTFRALDSTWGCDVDAHEETRAERFAAALLMPTDLVHAYSASRDEFGLALLFGVPLDAVRQRLADLGVEPPERSDNDEETPE